MNVSNALVEVVEMVTDRQVQLGFQLNVNLSTTDTLDKSIKKRTAKGSFLPTQTSDNVWKCM